MVHPHSNVGAARTILHFEQVAHAAALDQVFVGDDCQAILNERLGGAELSIRGTGVDEVTAIDVLVDLFVGHQLEVVSRSKVLHQCFSSFPGGYWLPRHSR